MKNSNHPFYEWVPRPIGILILLLMFVPPTFSGGAYLSNISEMVGGLGVRTEDVQLASFFTSIGMCLFPPFMVRFLQARRTKQTYLWCFAFLIVLNYVCAKATSLPLLLTACLLIGLVRIIVMLNCTFTIAPYLTGMDTLAMFTMTEMPPDDVQYALERKRTFLMPVLYGFILLISQTSNMLVAWCAYQYKWHDAYMFVVGMLLVCLLLVVCTMPNEKRRFTYQVEWHKLPEMLLMALCLCCMAFVLVYGKTLDWLDSKAVCVGLGGMFITGGAFLGLSIHQQRKAYLPLGVFNYRNVCMSMLLFVLTMVLNSAINFVGAFAKLSTSINNVQSACTLSGWAIVGCLLGLLLSLVLIVKKVRFAYIFSIAFVLMAVANACLYFQYQPMGLVSNFRIVMVLNYAGLLILYSIVAAFGMKGLPSHYLATFVFLMIWMRNVIAPICGTSVYSNWQYSEQQNYMSRLSQNVDNENALTCANFNIAKRGGKLQGMGTMEAEQYATTLLKSRVGVQSAIVSMKSITGQTVLLLLVAAGIALILPYRKGETT